MPAGLEVYNGNGLLVSSVTDRLTKLIASGAVNIGIGSSAFVSVVGVTNSDQFFVACSHGNVAVTTNGGFTLYQTGEYAGPYYYSVFRW